MSETRDPNELMGAAQDIAPLAWVINEIRTSLGDAVASVKAFLGAKQDLDRLRHARSNVHQANGALQLLDLRGGTRNAHLDHTNAVGQPQQFLRVG